MMKPVWSRLSSLVTIRWSGLSITSGTRWW
ncbi:hypothetical protein EYF80_064878 [Liparis tanakae]|uniref:Uncharacterized protein n=1 Tax=Liparis tanakae TaxID=230148 RepID=A0A4Z2E8A3_9TELE|nr:hypothetical protein EYF80_064878 [Liparis tanakae]